MYCCLLRFAMKLFHSFARFFLTFEFSTFFNSHSKQPNVEYCARQLRRHRFDRIRRPALGRDADRVSALLSACVCSLFNAAALFVQARCEESQGVRHRRQAARRHRR